MNTTILRICIVCSNVYVLSEFHSRVRLVKEFTIYFMIMKYKIFNQAPCKVPSGTYDRYSSINQSFLFITFWYIIMTLSGTDTNKVEKIHLGDAPSVKRVIDEQAVEVGVMIWLLY